MALTQLASMVNFDDFFFLNQGNIQSFWFLVDMPSTRLEEFIKK